ncbi:conserved hypothetical protein [Leishmania braziliensis MHOM/BR/75/M2904]|uniref:Uncharacterized protein n=2 Tax=Leishmania braziliensis TaxID=5660 RepID=A4H340_LEIBR|nr:conserved hypothetical protein [Leishmania braziliensis MHOM/BR/75/M2904]KAI5686219.1 hypothetical protein MNV84_00129 [Leishmania braziliensis]CAJ2465581.1 unnamed protein product [Leishmania braziliensis]CAJ2466120.1 unnamed protein product [Leishmania braziliensis]CAM36437.1 conserved hypothetical protein [Leishmania braziliensis MHOM/BR/75/M2904]SYZ62300.1 hypothetical_protein [Leishmania braziliensis MHOM/BR/75/M2904]
MRRLLLLCTHPIGCCTTATVAAAPALVFGARGIATSGRVTNEDRRWWLVHLECAPDVTAGTFVSWLDCCGTHTTKKLIERNIWTIEQVAELDSDRVDELKYREGCLKMDIVWEHARTIITPLKQREVSGGVESQLQSRILELRKKRELERQRESIAKERATLNDRREETLQKLRESIAARKAALRRKLDAQRSEAAPAAAAAESTSTEAHKESMEAAVENESVGSVVDRMSGNKPPRT